MFHTIYSCKHLTQEKENIQSSGGLISHFQFNDVLGGDSTLDRIHSKRLSMKNYSTCIKLND